MSKLIKKLFIIILVIVIAIGIIHKLNIKNYIMKNMYPKEYSEYVYKYSEENNIDPLLTFAIIKAESNFNPEATSNSNAIGLMQVLETTAKEVMQNKTEENFSKEILFNAEDNIKIGTTYFAYLLDKYNGNIALALTAYNAGIGKVDNWIENGIIKEASDGHGGIFQSMKKNNITADMEKRGVKWAFIGPVDNVLVKMVDPVLLGVMIDKNVSAGGKSVVKANPSEKVGVFCKRNGKPGVVEYTEISKEMAERTDTNGELVFGESHINCNMFSVKAIEDVANKNLPYHVAHKKASYLDENGNLVVPDKPNAYKFESFIFDAFDMLDDMAILRVKREDEFAPVKNAEGTDSPETARALYKKFYNIK